MINNGMHQPLLDMVQLKGAGTSRPHMVDKESNSKTACTGILQLELNYEVLK
jgi:hypothetical protein